MPNNTGVDFKKDKISVSHINIRQSISLLILRLILIDIIAAAIFTAFHSFLFSPQVSEVLAINQDIYNIFAFLLLLIGKILLTAYIVFEWLNEYWEITSESIIHKKGVIFRNTEVRDIEKIRSVTLIRGPLAEILNFGTIRLYDIRLNKYMDLYLIHNPARYLRILEDLIPKLEESKELFAEKG